MAHEIFHAVFSSLPSDVGVKLLHHAFDLRIMDLPAREYLMAIGREDLAVRVKDLNATWLGESEGRAGAGEARAISADRYLMFQTW